MAVSDEQRELNRPRQRRKLQRRQALDLAHRDAVDAIRRQLAEEQPAWFTQEQVWAYEEELRRLCGTIGGPALARVRA